MNRLGSSCLFVAVLCFLSASVFLSNRGQGGESAFAAGPRGAATAGPKAPDQARQGSDAARVVIGPGANINSAIARGVTATFTLQPVDPKTVPASSYPAGSMIVGQEITLASVPPGGQRVWLDVRATSWDPHVLKALQARLSATDPEGDGGGLSGANAVCGGSTPGGADLEIAMIPCAVNADCRATTSGISSACSAGEPSRCKAAGGANFPWFPPGNYCEPGFQNRCEASWIGVGTSVTAAADVSNKDIRWAFAVEPGDVPIDFHPSYVGTVVINVPPGARGSYTLDFVESGTWMQELVPPDTLYIPIAAMNPGIITVPCGSCCFGNEGVYCIDRMSRAECDAMGLPGTFKPGVICTGNPAVDCPGGTMPGVDCYRVECGLTEFGFGAAPIPGDFFGPGCDPFAGAIFAGGSTGSGDLKIRRLDPMFFGAPPSLQWTSIQVDSLDLISCAPIVVQCPGGLTEWHVSIGQSLAPVSPGWLDATKTHANGGTFTMDYSVLPRLIFSRVGGPGDVRIFDFAEQGRAPIALQTVGTAPWVQSATIPIATPCAEGFVPGVEEQPGTHIQQCRKVVATAPDNTIAGGPPGCDQPSGACCLPSGTCEVVSPELGLTARQVCERQPAEGGRGGTYTDDSTDCRDTDGDGIPDVLETNNASDCQGGNACKRGTNPNTPDTDGDGCPDGSDLAPCDPCVPAGGCSGFPDCDGNGIVDNCELPGNDCNSNGILDRCDTTLTGACCNTMSGCAELTKAACDSLPGWVYQGFCTHCPTQGVMTNIHEGIAVVHFPTPVPECSITGGLAAARAEDCTLRQCLYDTWITDPNEPTCHDFAGTGPAPAVPSGFFGPGSDPYVGVVCFQGLPLGPTQYGDYGDADTIICRSADPFGRCALPSTTESTVPIRIVALRLVSLNPIVVTYNNGQSAEQWNVAVSLSDNPSPQGSLTAVKTHCNGGTYTSVLPVQPKFTFTKAAPPGTQLVLDTGIALGWPVFTLIQDPVPPAEDPSWIHDPQTGLSVVLDACSNFHPGIRDLSQAPACDCNNNGIRDKCDIEGTSRDCNSNGIPDECELSGNDCNSNGIPDQCEPDCNRNGRADGCDVPPPAGTCTSACSADCNANGIPDECEPDCNGNGIPDSCDLVALRSLDCQPNGRPDECDIASGLVVDCQRNGIPDNCELLSGAAADCNGNGIPDACENIPPGSPQPNPSGIASTRFLSFIPGNPGQETAIRVTLIALHHVDPPYTGGASVPFTLFESQDQWVGPPTQYLESVSSGTLFYASHLQCTPYYQDWSTIGVLHVTGAAIVPSSSYEVAVIAAACNTSVGQNYSGSLSVVTTRWGDVDYPYNPPPGTVQPDTTDISALVNKFKSALGAPIKARALLASLNRRGIIDIVPDTSFIHISACVDAFKGLPYPYKPGKCAGGLRGCIADLDCTGGGNNCVGGTNDGEACNPGVVCGGGGVCTPNAPPCVLCP